MKKAEFRLSDDNKSILTLYCHDALDNQEASKRPFVLVFPGGGYSFCSSREAEPVALKYYSEGFHAGVLRYSVGDRRSFKNALDEATHSIEFLRDNHELYGIDPERIYVIGFSAGGHLAAALSNLSEHKPNGCILGYPALLRSYAALMNIKAPSLDLCVSDNTPPTFIFTTFWDDLVPVENTVRYIAALEEHEVPFEAHIFEKGGHGLSLADENLSENPSHVERHFSKWFDLSVNWIRLQSVENPTIPDNAIRKLMEHKDIKPVLLILIPKLSNMEVYKVVKNLSLTEAVSLYKSQLGEDEAKQVDEYINASILKDYMD